jgi:hypothetical protein
MNLFKTKTILNKILILIFFCTSIYAQDKDEDYKYWLTLGMLIDGNVSFNIDYSFSIKEKFFKAGYFIRGGISEEPSPGRDGYLFNSFDFSIGQRILFNWAQISMFTGPSYVFGKKQIQDGKTKDFKTFGLQTNFQLLFKPANEIGLGIGLYGNINFIKNYLGVNLNITIGNGK